MEAQEWCRKYMKSGNVKDLTQAWDLYYHVFRRISKQLPQVSGEVQFCCGPYSATCQYKSVSCFLFEIFRFSILGITACDLLRSCINSKLAAYTALKY